MTAFALADKVCLITGATGIAAATARLVVREGGRVFVASLRPEDGRALHETIRADGPEPAFGFQAADLTRAAEVKTTVEACVERFGRIDAVFNVAGISGRRFGDGPLHELTADGWDTVMAANARSTFLVARAVVRHLLARQSPGALLLMSSVLARRPAPEHFGTHAYAASKGAIEAFIRATAASYAPHGIRINGIAPSLVATPMSRRAQEDQAVLGYLAGKQPLAGGPVDADDVASVALHLLSDEARMVTGQVVTVDAGWSVSEPPTR